MPEERADAIVIGGGIVGAATTYYLSRAGLRTVLLERGQLCGEASGANLGWLTISTKPPGVLLDLTLLSWREYAGFDERIDPRAHVQRTGGLVCCATEAELAAREELTRQQRAVGIDVRMVSGDEARAIEPVTPAAVIGGSHCPDDGLVYPFGAVLGFAAAATRLGARILTETPALAVRRNAGAVEGVETPRGPALAPVVVNCAGAWADAVGRMVDFPIPVVPCRGQAMVTEPTRPMIRGIIMGGAPVSLRQTHAGNVVVGSTKEYVGEDKSTVLDVLLGYGREGVGAYPWLADLKVIRAWAGLRPATPDELPILGPVESVPGYYVAGGAFRNGMMYGPALGLLLTQLVTGRRPEIDISPLNPLRFQRQPAPA